MAEEHNTFSGESQNTSNVADTQSTHQEKMLSQSEVNSLIGRAKQEGYQKALKESQPQQQASMSNSSNVDDIMSKFEKTLDERLNFRLAEQKRLQEEQAQKAQQTALIKEASRIVEDFNRKCKDASSRYEDFEDVKNSLNLNDPNKGGLVLMANQYDNAGDIIYELGKNLDKAAKIIGLMNVDPSWAESEMKRLSDSIKQNQQAINSPQARAPLSQMQTTTNVGSGGDYNDLQSLKKADWLKG